jgi:VIT1/CCC1 family predicted Fe2+/Mn2+ transporter
MSPMSATAQFQAVPRQLSNLDRCNLCGLARAAHGPDWSCPSGVRADSRWVTRSVVAFGLVVIAGVIVLLATSTTGSTLASLAAAVCLCGLTLLVCAVILAGRRP